jgi:hypothetical protein
MTALTIRKIPSRVEKVIRDKAAREHVSLNKAVVEMLEESVIGKQKPQPPRYHDLDWMCGTLGEKQYSRFSKHLAKTRIIDPELWQ